MNDGWFSLLYYLAVFASVVLLSLKRELFTLLAKPYIEKAVHRPVDIRAVARILQPRCDVLTSIEESLDFIDELPEYNIEMYIHKKMKTTYEIALKALKASEQALSELHDWSSEETIHDLLLSLPKQMEMKNGQILWPIRTAITGKQFTPGGAIEIAHILGKEETLKRIAIGIEKLEKVLA